MAPASSSFSGLAGKYLTVVVENEAYGIAVLKVREIIRLQKTTPLPHLPAYVKGVINLRGRVIPIVDLRIKFGLHAEYLARTCIVVVHVTPPGAASLQMGLIVDRVEDVVTLDATQIEPTPDFGGHATNSLILGMAKINGQVQSLLDIDRVITDDALPALPASHSDPAPANSAGGDLRASRT
jgi:purine-binding chemotaxis protein CheW